MRALVLSFVLLVLAACSSGDSVVGPTEPPAACSNDDQKAFVLNALYDWYLWNDLLPANISIDDYASPEELVIEVTETFGPQKADGSGPLDRFSGVGSLQADQQFFGEGRYEGFGFSWILENDELTFSRVFVDSPAGAAGFARGQKVLTLDGIAIADVGGYEGIGQILTANTVEFLVQNPDGSTFIRDVTKDIVTIDPIPDASVRIIDQGPGLPPVGYFELATFISTANPEFDTIFGDFRANGVRDVIVDMRYNGGGLVSTAELLGDYLGGLDNDGQVFSNTEFNADRGPANNSTDFFAVRGNSVSLDRLIIVASSGTASASELVTNSLDPYLADGVYIVGENTFGKPVGQIGLEFCEKILRPTSFKLTNAAGFGDYFDGLPVDCAAPDDLSFPVGDDQDPNVIAALSYVNGAGCPTASLPGSLQKPSIFDREKPDLSGPPEREFANAY